MLENIHWTGRVESVAFSIGNKDIAWYGIIITCAMLFGLFLAIKLGKKIKLKSDDMLEVFLIAIPVAVLCARLGYVIFRPSIYFPSDFGWKDFVEIFAVWDGGLTIMTGAVGGVLGALIWCKWRKADFVTLIDTVIYVVLICQAIGRWGNFCNQEIYGAEIINPDNQWFPLAVYIARRGGWYQATFFYEFVLNIIGFVIIMMVQKRLDIRGKGFMLYGGAYGLIRFIMEFMRDDGDVYDVVNFNQIICGVVFVVCMGLLAYFIIMKKKKDERVWYGKGIPQKLIQPLRLELRKETGATGEANATADAPVEVVKKPKTTKNGIPFNKKKKK